jgi:hypothetical protein
MTNKFTTEGIEYSIKRTGRTSLEISVERDGIVIVNAPQDADSAAIAKFVSSKRLWIHQKLAYKIQTNKEKIHRDFVNGQGFLYLGKSYRLKLMKNGDGRDSVKKSDGSHLLRFNHGHFELPENEQARARGHFIKWYKKQTEQQMRLRILRYDKRVGAEVQCIRVLDLGNRWASCGDKGTLNFNWRIVMAPVWVFDYILVHEMAHMLQKGHTKDFWRLVSRVIPDYEEHKAWLQEHGVEMDI